MLSRRRFMSLLCRSDFRHIPVAEINNHAFNEFNDTHSVADDAFGDETGI